MLEPQSVIYTVSQQEIIVAQTITHIWEKLPLRFVELTQLKQYQVRNPLDPNEINTHWRLKTIFVNTANITAVVPYGDHLKQEGETVERGHREPA